MEHWAGHTRAVQIDKGVVREVAGYQNWQFLNFFQVVFTQVAQPLAAESMLARYQKEATFTSLLSGPT